MSSITADGLAAPAGGLAGGEVGPLEQKHLQYPNYRAVTDGTEISKTHWHIATANALGWGFDGMDGVIFALISPLVIKEFSLTVPEYRSGLVRRYRRPVFLAVALRPPRAAHAARG